MSSLRTLSLRSHLALLVVGTLVPVAAFAAVVVVRLSNQERATFERRLRQSAIVLAADVDREMTANIRSLQALASSESLRRGDLAKFHATASRGVSVQPSWRGVSVSSGDGTRLLNTVQPWGAPLHAAVDPASLARVVRTAQPAIGDAASIRGTPLAFPVRVPVLIDGGVRYVLTAVIESEALMSLVTERASAEDEWTRTIIDRNGLIVARSRSPERFVGQAATPLFRAQARASRDGLYRGTTMDGVSAYIAFATGPQAGWTAAVVVPAEVIEGTVRKSTLAVLGIGFLLLLVSGGGAFFLSRRVSQGIGEAATAADALAHGTRPQMAPTSVAEIHRLDEALRRSADLLAAREHERDELLARAETARVEAEQASRAKDEFLAMLGHELRNPLSPILTALQLLALKGEASSREHGVIRRQAEHMVRLVDDLLDVSRIARGKIELRRETLDIGPVIAKAVEMTSPLFEDREQALSVVVPAGTLFVDGDPMRLAQVFANLLTNAARYTPRRGHIAVMAAADRGEVVVAVQDDGEGLPADLQPRIFEMFVQGVRSSERAPGGLGIGLTLVKNLVRTHGGTVEAHSAGPGLGSTFVVRLPASAPPPALAAPVDTLPRPIRAHPPLRILVVDDNRDAADLLTDLCRRAGHEVRTAYDPAAGLKIAQAFEPQLAVLDLGLPVMDGIELAERMRERFGGDRPVLVAVTGYGQPHDRQRSREAGFRFHLVKPVQPDILLTAIEAIAGEFGLSAAP